MRRSMSHWYFGQEEVGGGSRPAISMIGHRAGGATRITLPVRDRHARDDRAAAACGRGRHALFCQGQTLPSHELPGIVVVLRRGLKRCGVVMGKNVASTFVCDNLDQPRAKKMAPEIRSQVLGGTMHRAEGRDNLGNFLISLELRRRRAECRRCGYLPPRRPSASGRGWQGNGRTGCWRSEGRSWRSWTSGFSGCREAVGVPSFRE